MESLLAAGTSPVISSNAVCLIERTQSTAPQLGSFLRTCVRVANHFASFSTYRGPFGSYPVVLTTQYRSREEISGFGSLAPPIQNMWLSTLVKADAVEGPRSAGRRALDQRKMHFQPLQNALSFVVRPFVPYKRLVIVAEPRFG
jgi:hypothetical protein